MSSSSTSSDVVDPLVNLRTKGPTPQRAVKRCHLLAAIDALKLVSNGKPRVWRANCSTDVRTRLSEFEKVKKPSKKFLLLYTLRNAIGRHDWSTAALCVKFMMEASYDNKLFLNSIVIILFNHPDTTENTVQQFLTEVLSLRNTKDQMSLINHMFHLPETLDVYKEGSLLDDMQQSDEDDSMDVVVKY